MSHPPAYPHDPIEEVQPDVFVVRGSIPLNALLTITRNMAIVRHAGELTLVDPIRLSPAEEHRLDGLGDVKRILRLGPMHSVDDPYYLERYGAELWAPAPASAHDEPKPTREFDATTPPPFPDAEFFVFDGTKRPEAALLLRRGPGLLVTCDAIQHYGDYRHNNLPARLLMPFIGFPKRTIVGPIWLKNMTPAGASLEGEFRRLAALDFDRLFTAHGSFLASGARASVERAVDAAFGGGR